MWVKEAKIKTIRFYMKMKKKMNKNQNIMIEMVRPH